MDIRWGSTFDMMDRLFLLKEACVTLSESYKELRLSTYDWDTIKSAVGFIFISIKVLYFLNS